MPTRVCRGAVDFIRLDQLQPRSHSRALGIVLVGSRIAEIHQHTIPHVLRYEPGVNETVERTDGRGWGGAVYAPIVPFAAAALAAWQSSPPSAGPRRG